jgi:hypothetical protein
MTPSIIRRFARYHGVDVVLPDEPGFNLNVYSQLGTAIYKPSPNNWAERCTAHDKIIEQLTRIEDAEHALSRASLVYFGRTAREQNEADAIADELFAKAGIDPDKWREVKDEEA